MYRFESAMVVSCSVRLICVLRLLFANAAAVTIIIKRARVIVFHHVQIYLTNYEICNILCLNK